MLKELLEKIDEFLEKEWAGYLNRSFSPVVDLGTGTVQLWIGTLSGTEPLIQIRCYCGDDQGHFEITDSISQEINEYNVQEVSEAIEVIKEILGSNKTAYKTLSELKTAYEEGRF